MINYEVTNEEAAILLTGLAVLSNMVITEHGMTSAEYQQTMDVMAKISAGLNND